MRLKIVELTSLNINQVYSDSEWTFPHPRPVDLHDRRRAWPMEMLSNGLRHFSAFKGLPPHFSFGLNPVKLN